MNHAGRSRVGLRLMGGLALIVATAIGTWAVFTVLEPAEDPLEAAEHTYVKVAQGEAGASLSLNVVAEWKPVPMAVNQAAGVVTAVNVVAGDEVSQGSQLYSVNLRPVFVARGEVPAFRAISEGAEGADVVQMQALLADLGFYGGAQDGKSGAATVRAVKAWQKSLGLPQTGVVEVGDVIFAPTLPTRIAPNNEVLFRGAALAGGEDVANGLPVAPHFSIPATEGQAAMMPTGVRVEVTSPEGGTWLGEIADQRRVAETSTVEVGVNADAEGASLCGEECAQVPVTGQSTLAARVVTTETVEGLVVPSAALVSGADGVVSVIDKKGTRIPVSVIASAKGMSVVEGVDAGLSVRVPASDAGAE